jgi:hypothetical protein
MRLHTAIVSQKTHGSIIGDTQVTNGSHAIRECAMAEIRAANDVENREPGTGIRYLAVMLEGVRKVCQLAVAKKNMFLVNATGYPGLVLTNPTPHKENT